MTPPVNAGLARFADDPCREYEPEINPSPAGGIGDAGVSDGRSVGGRLVGTFVPVLVGLGFFVAVAGGFVLAGRRVEVASGLRFVACSVLTGVRVGVQVGVAVWERVVAVASNWEKMLAALVPKLACAPDASEELAGAVRVGREKSITPSSGSCP